MMQILTQYILSVNSASVQKETILELVDTLQVHLLTIHQYGPSVYEPLPEDRMLAGT
jgi:hypothetical protein